MIRKKYHYKTLKDSVTLLLKKAGDSSLSIGEVIDILSEKGRPLLLIFLTLPFCQPIQIPGLSTPFGLVIAFMGLRMTFKKQIWLPKKILAKEIASKTLKQIGHKTLQVIVSFQRWIHPRIDWASHHPAMEIANGIMIFLLGMFLALPLPIPFSNLIAAWPIFFICLGILEDDGLFVLLGYVSTFVAFTFLAIVMFKLYSYYLK